MNEFDIKVMDQFVREEGSPKEVEAWTTIKFRLKELEAEMSKSFEDCGSNTIGNNF